MNDCVNEAFAILSLHIERAMTPCITLGAFGPVMVNLANGLENIMIKPLSKDLQAAGAPCQVRVCESSLMKLADNS